MNESKPNPEEPVEPEHQPPVPPRGEDDCFAPPAEPCECYCLHCGRVFMSDGIWFQKIIGSRDDFDGFWMCPTPNCDGAGFTFDLFPTDPQHPANAGWTDTDDEEDELFSDGGENASATSTDDIPPWDPNEPAYTEMDDEIPYDDDDMEGEEWKHGLQPGEQPPDSPWTAEARKQWEQEQAKYNGPDLRPRMRDWSDREEMKNQDGKPIEDEDIPFRRERIFNRRLRRFRR